MQMLVVYGIRQDGSRHLLASCTAREKVSRLGSLLEGSLPGGLEGRSLHLIHHRRLCRIGGVDSHRLSASASSALLGAQDAQHSGEGT